VRVHIGAVNANRKAQPPYWNFRDVNDTRAYDDILLDHPVLFSKRVKASLVETLLSPESTNNVAIAAIVVPTAGSTRIKRSEYRPFSLSIDKCIKQIDAS